MKEYLVSARTGEVFERDYVGEPPEEAPAPGGYVIFKSTIVRRLIAADAIGPALDLLDAPENRVLKALWDASTIIESDHPETDYLRTMLGQIEGLDVAAILAPEA